MGVGEKGRRSTEREGRGVGDEEVSGCWGGELFGMQRGDVVWRGNERAMERGTFDGEKEKSLLGESGR